VVDADAVAVVRPARLRLPQADRHDSGPTEIDDPLATFAGDLTRPRVAERLEQRAVKGKAPAEVGDDEIEVVDARPAHHLKLRDGGTRTPAAKSVDTCDQLGRCRLVLPTPTFGLVC
jgi:hypothetical protein